MALLGSLWLMISAVSSSPAQIMTIPELASRCKACCRTNGKSPQTDGYCKSSFLTMRGDNWGELGADKFRPRRGQINTYQWPRANHTTHLSLLQRTELAPPPPTRSINGACRWFVALAGRALRLRFVPCVVPFPVQRRRSRILWPSKLSQAIGSLIIRPPRSTLISNQELVKKL